MLDYIIFYRDFKVKNFMTVSQNLGLFLKAFEFASFFDALNLKTDETSDKGASCKIHQASDFFLKTDDFFENGGHETTPGISGCAPHKIQRRLSHALSEHDSRYLESIARRIISQLNARSRPANGETPAFCHGSGSEAGRDFYSDAFVRSWSAPRGPPGLGAVLHCQGGLEPADHAGVARPSPV